MARTIAGAAPGRTNRRFLIIAVLLAGLSATLMYAVLARGDSGTTEPVSAGSTQVVVAKALILQNTVIRPEQLDLKSVPTNLVNVGAFVTIEDVAGTVAKYPLDINQQITSTAVIDTDNPVAEQGLSVVVPSGQRAMSIAASQVGNAGGLILPGDFVDLIWVDAGGVIAKTLIQNVQVAAVAQTVGLGPTDRPAAGEPGAPTDPDSGPVAVGEPEPLPDADTITLLITPQQGQTIFLASQIGTFRAELRGPGDLETPDTGTTRYIDIVTPEDVAPLPEALKPEGYKAAQ